MTPFPFISFFHFLSFPSFPFPPMVESADREMSTTAIGELLMDRLQLLDKIAYVRFASVYRDFQDVEAFLSELKDVPRKRG